MKKLSLALLSLGLLVIFGVPTFSHALPSPTVADIDPNGDATSNSCVTLSSAGLRYRATDYVTGGEVSLLQDFLISKGFLSGQPTGFFGNMTFSAVKSFQKSSGYVPTGYVGNLTKARIKELSCNGATTLPDVPGTKPSVTTGQVVPSTSVKSTLTVLTPVNPTTHGDTFSTGETVPLAWSSKEFGVNRIYLLSETGNRVATILSTNENGSFPYTGSTYSWTIPNTIPTGTYKVRVIIGLEGLSTSPVGDSGTFKIRNTINTTSFSATTTVYPLINSVYLQNVSEDKAGLWANFGSGTGNINKNSADWNWVMNMNVPSGVNKYIKRITVVHNTSGEVWSTGYSRYLGDGTDLYGREEHPYPLVVTQSGVQLNKSYDQSLGEKPFLPGNYELKLYGQPESTTFTGGKLIVEFTDGTKTTALIPASSMRQSSVSALTQPSITVLSPNGGSSYSVGSKINIKWSFSNFPIPNNPPVDVLLIRKVSGDAYTGVTTIAENILGGLYDWTVPTSIPNGSNYMILVQTNGQTINGMEQKGYVSRSGTFSITGSTNHVSASVSPANVVVGNSIRVTVDTRNSDVNDKTKHIILSLQSSDGSSYIPANFIYSKDSQGRWYADYVVPSTAKQGTWIIRQIGLFDDNRVLKYLNYPDDINYTFTVGGSTNQPSITVLSPNGGESFVQGNNLTGSFTTSNIAYGTFCEVAIVGRKSDGNPVDVTIATPKTLATDKQVYSGKVPADLVPVGSYKIRVDCGGERLIAQDQSDSYFTITSPITPVTPTPLTVLTPINPTTHGDTFSTGETVPLAWSSKEFGVNRIYLLSETGSKVATILSTNENGTFPYTGSTYSWTIPNTIPTGTYKIRVIIGLEGMSTSPVGDSGVFKIRNTASVAPAQPTVQDTTTSYNSDYMTANMLEALKLVNPMYR